ncbi:MAG: hypothetical protein WBR18_13220 [Anaerolineales bacterium]
MMRTAATRKPQSRWLVPALGLITTMALTACGGLPSRAADAVAVGGGLAEAAGLDVQRAEADTGVGTYSIVVPTDTRTDEQGAVVVTVRPRSESLLNDQLAFDVSMNTHSVDLSMDLAQLARLETDNGLCITPSSWSGGTGHHVNGQLVFDLPPGEGLDTFFQASSWSLTLLDVDAPERVFNWSLGGAK